MDSWWQGGDRVERRAARAGGRNSVQSGGHLSTGKASATVAAAVPAALCCCPDRRTSPLASQSRARDQAAAGPLLRPSLWCYVSALTLPADSP